MTECNPISTPMEQKMKLTSSEGKEFEDVTKYRQLVGRLIYLTTTRLDISYVVGILSRFMHKPCEGHCSAAKRVLRYLKGTQDVGRTLKWMTSNLLGTQTQILMAIRRQEYQLLDTV